MAAMSRFYVLNPPGADRSGMKTLFVRDGFSWFGFLLPLPYLLFRRMWILALAVALLYVLGFIGAGSFGLEALPLAFGMVISLWVGLEGGHRRALMLQRRGFRQEAIVLGRNLAEAEQAFFSRSAAGEPQAATTAVVARPGAAGTRQAVALGLIGPYGGR